MNFISHLLVAIVYLGVFLVTVLVDKKVAFVFAISASFLLVLAGLCTNVNLYFACIAWSAVDIILMAYILLFKKKAKTIVYSIVQIILFSIWLWIRFV